MSTVFTCPECESDIPLPEGRHEGVITCETCKSEFMYGKYLGKNPPAPEMVNAYYNFIAPELIALQKKILLFDEQNPESRLFSPETIEETKKTIENAIALLEEAEQPLENTED